MNGPRGTRLRLERLEGRWLLNGDEPFAYILNGGDFSGTSSLSVIDPATNAVVRSIDLGALTFAKAVTAVPTAIRAYVATSLGVTVVDTANDTVRNTVATPHSLDDVAVSPDGRTVYASGGSKLSVVDVASNSVVTTLDVPASDSVSKNRVAVNADGSRIFVTGRGGVAAINAATNTVITTVNVSGTLSDVAVAGSKVFVSRALNCDPIVVIDAGSNTVAGTVAVDGNCTSRLAANPAGSRVYATHPFVSRVSEIDVAAQTKTANLPLSTEGFGVGVHPGGTRIYVTHSFANRVSILNTSGGLVASVDVGASPIDVAFASKQPTSGTGARPIVLSGQKFDDLDGDGRKDANEPGLPGWTIELDLDSDGTIDGTTTTDANGNYTFAGMAAGANVNISRFLSGMQAETAIAVNPTNPLHLVAAANDRGGDRVWLSTDGGASWRSPLIPLPPGARAGNGDPSIVFNRAGTRIVYAHMVDYGKASIATAVSTDGGNSWTAGLVTPQNVFNNNDRPYLAVGPSPNDPSQDRFYIAWHRGNVIMAASSGDGLDWNAPTDSDPNITDNDNFRVSDGADGIVSIPAVAPDGTLYIVWEDFGTDGIGRIMLDRSLDGGRTWGTDREIQRTSVNLARDPFRGGRGWDGRIERGGGLGEYEITAQPRRGISMGLSFDIDRSGGPFHGRMYVAFIDQADGDGDPDANNPVDHDDTNVYVIWSDDGVTWTRTPVHTDPLLSSQFFPWLDVDQTNGTLAVAWYDTRNDLGIRTPNDPDEFTDTAAELFASVSFDGGATFQPQTRVSQGTSNVAMTNNAFEFGDYIGLSFHDGAFYPIWTDNSNSTGDNIDGLASWPDVYTVLVRVIRAGTHTVREVLRPDYRQTAPAGRTHRVTVSGGQTITGLDFGNFELGTIRGQKFLDANSDGMSQPAEIGLAGWTIFLNPRDTNGDGIFDTGLRSTLTGADGAYEFTGLAAGNYTVGEQRQPRWRQTGPVPTAPGTHLVTVAGFASGELYEGRDFLNAPTQSVIVGRKFEDRDHNAARNGTEPYLKDWVIFIDANLDGVLTNPVSGNGVADRFATDPWVRTDANGYYVFGNLGLGTYPVLEVLQAGWQQTTNNPGFVSVDGSPRVFAGPDFGNFRLGSVSGLVFLDTNRDGFADRLEPGLEDWVVFVDLNGDGVLNRTAGSGVCDAAALEPCDKTDALGEYKIVSRVPVGTFAVRLVVQPGFVTTAPVNPSFHRVTVSTSGAEFRQLHFGVAEENVAPVGIDDVYELSFDQDTFSSTVFDSVVSNDFDPDGDILSANVTASPLEGFLNFGPDGTFTYSAFEDFSGVDQFRYVADDGRLTSQQTTVTVMSGTGFLVRKVYLQVLRREPELEGWRYWINQLDQEQRPLGEVASGIFESNERLNPIIAQMYRDFLFREPDDSGVAYWRDQVWKRDGGPENVIAGIISSPEFFRAAGGTNRLWVTELYRRLLRREPDPQGLDYWTARLANNEQSRQDVVLGFVRSKENRRALVQGWYLQYLGRPADAGAEDFYVRQMELGVSQRAIQIQLINSDEYRSTPPPPEPGTGQRA